MNFSIDNPLQKYFGEKPSGEQGLIYLISLMDEIPQFK